MKFLSALIVFTTIANVVGQISVLDALGFDGFGSLGGFGLSGLDGLGGPLGGLGMQGLAGLDLAHNPYLREYVVKAVIKDLTSVALTQINKIGQTDFESQKLHLQKYARLLLTVSKYLAQSSSQNHGYIQEQGYPYNHGYPQTPIYSQNQQQSSRPHIDYVDSQGHVVSTPQILGLDGLLGFGGLGGSSLSGLGSLIGPLGVLAMQGLASLDLAHNPYLKEYVVNSILKDQTTATLIQINKIGQTDLKAQKLLLQQYARLFLTVSRYLTESSSQNHGYILKQGYPYNRGYPEYPQTRRSSQYQQQSFRPRTDYVDSREHVVSTPYYPHTNQD